MVNAHDATYARYIALAAAALIVIATAVWVFKMMPHKAVNQDPRVGRVCLDTSCRVQKQCDQTTLVIYTKTPGSDITTKQRVPNSVECQSVVN